MTRNGGRADDPAAWGREVIDTEIHALTGLRATLGDEFAAAVGWIREAVERDGKVIVTGLGKSGLVARRIASTFTSLGTPSIFLHPVEALHGDIGLMRRGDVALAFSQSGETEEVVSLAPIFRRMAIWVVAVTGRSGSSLAREADLVLDTRVDAEACAFGLAPTSSCAVQAALGDAMAVAVCRLRGLTEEDFHFRHPGGTLGQRLRLKVRDVMHSGDRLPRVREDAQVSEAVVEIMEKRLGVTSVVDDEGRLTGILTDGDLKRILLRHRNIMDLPVRDVMTREPRTIDALAPLARALAQMEQDPKRLITSLLVVNGKGEPEGVIHLHDCLQAGMA